MKSIRVKITPATGAPWFATAMQNLATPEKQIVFLNRQAKKAALPATYALATEAEYLAYKGERSK